MMILIVSRIKISHINKFQNASETFSECVNFQKFSGGACSQTPLADANGIYTCSQYARKNISPPTFTTPSPPLLYIPIRRDTTSSLAAKFVAGTHQWAVSRTRTVVHEDGFQVLLRSKEAETMETVDNFFTVR